MNRKRARDSQDGLFAVAGRRNRVKDLRRDFAMDEEVAKGRAQWWDPQLREIGGASPSSSLDSVDAATSARTGDRRDKSSEGLFPTAVKEQAAFVKAAKF